MTRFGLAALCAAITLGACATTDIASRASGADALYGGFDAPSTYAVQPVGTRADNDFLRFSTMSMTR